MATADSRIKRRIWAIIRRLINMKVKFGPVFPSSVIKRCPAIILADSRTANVPGRIIFLIVSMHTIKGMSAGGVPWGTKCANI